ncbi:unnamed protein product [Aspergillus oryzae]|nr:unnamed protein product [Aspergillus oryzae]
MATPEDAEFVQQQIGYGFHDQATLLLALTAAGKGGREDEKEKRGNSRLAQLGNYLMQLLLVYVGYSGNRSRAVTLEDLYNATQPAVNQPVAASVLEGETNLTLIEPISQAPVDLNCTEVPEIVSDIDFISTEFLNNLPPMRETDMTEMNSETAIGTIKRRKLVSGGRGACSNDGSASYRTTTWLGQYLVEEQERCISHNIAPPAETFLTKHIIEELRALGKHFNTSILVHVLIASSTAFATLRELASFSKEADDLAFWEIQPAVSARARFDIIKRLDNKIAGYAILRRYHILQFFEENVPTNSRVLTDFINASPGDFQETRGPGNPNNNAKSEITCRMIEAIYPGLDSSSGEFRSIYRVVSKLQVLGKRYHAMVSKFHKGILGLLPPSGLTQPIDVGISDNM